MYYRLVDREGQPYEFGMPGIYSGVAAIAERVPDAEADARGLATADGSPAPGWIWWPGVADPRNART